MMYVAVPAPRGNRIDAVMRAAIPLTTVNRQLDALYVRIGLSALVFAPSRRSSASSLGAHQLVRCVRSGAARAASPAGISPARCMCRAPRSSPPSRRVSTRWRRCWREDRDAHPGAQRARGCALSMVEGVLAVNPEERVIPVNAAAARLIAVRAGGGRGQDRPGVLRNPDLQRVVAQPLRPGAGGGGHRPVGGRRRPLLPG